MAMFAILADAHHGWTEVASGVKFMYNPTPDQKVKLPTHSGQTLE
jgi:hypothetical protein